MGDKDSDQLKTNKSHIIISTGKSRGFLIRTTKGVVFLILSTMLGFKSTVFCSEKDPGDKS